VVKLAEFLLWLRDEKGLAVSTIEGYRTAIASTLRGKTGEDLGKDADLSRLLANFAREHRPRRSATPPWNLVTVLDSLIKPPYEPLHLAPMKFLTWKTVFLLAFATGSRRSELHALTKSFRRSEGWKSVTLFLDSSFIAKTELASSVKDSRPLTIPALGTQTGHAEDSTLCPVRALRCYMDRTSEIREDKEKLLIAYKQGFKGDITKATLSHWLKKTVLYAYNTAAAGEEDIRVRAHDIRGLSASWARLTNLTLESIMDACSWKSHNTFTSYYLKDLALIQEDMFTFGPIVAAKQIAQIC
jgi:hypothetical protein